MAANEIKERSDKDQVLQQVIAAVQTNKRGKNFQSCYGIRDQLSVAKNLPLKEHQLVIEETLQQKALQIDHS